MDSPFDRAIVEEVLARHIARESLKHPRHADVLNPLVKRVRGMLIQRWNRQQRALLAEASHWIKAIADGKREAINTDEYKRLQAQVSAKLNAGTALSGSSRRDISIFNAAIEASATGAIRNLSIELDIEAAAHAGTTFARSYLLRKGFSRLAADIDETTADRMANAVAAELAGDGTYDDAVKAIKDTFQSMKDSRAETIAKTELADAYNQAMLSSAKESGDLLKTWNLDGEGCEEICQPNAEDGAIGLDEDFSSGDDAPPAHPNCDCSIGFVRASEA